MPCSIPEKRKRTCASERAGSTADVLATARARHSPLTSRTFTCVLRQRAETEPVRQLSRERGASDDRDASGADLRAQIANTAPGFDEQAQVRAHENVDLVARILEAHVDGPTVAHEPEAARIVRRAAELEVEHDAAGRHAYGVQLHVHAPEQKGGIEIVGAHVPRPVLAP